MSLPFTIALVTAALFYATSSSMAQAPGGPTYVAKCQMCHGATGAADTPAGKAMGTHPFKAPEVVKMSDGDLSATIKNGKGKMPSFAGKLKDPEVTALVTYIRGLQK
jgi:mono/diheme cytochrome c family protein